MPTVIEKFETYQRRNNLSEQTIALRNNQLHLYERETGLRVEKSKPEDFQLFLDSRLRHDGSPISAKTRSCYLTTFSSFFKWGVKTDEWEKNPIEKMDRPKVHNGMPNPIPEFDLARALKKAGPLMRCWITFEAYGGLRCKEVAMLETRDIRYDTDQVHVRFGKGGKERMVPLHPEMARALKAYDKQQRFTRETAFRAEGEGRLWPRCNPASVSQRINRFYHGMGITHTAHKNRHRAGTQIRKASGGDLLAVQRFLGHSDPKTAAIYAAIDDEEVQTAAMLIPVAGQKANEAPSDYFDDEAINQ